MRITEKTELDSPRTPRLASYRAMISTVLVVFIVSMCAMVALASDIITLTSKNFEHETQASTGSTTGDWIVKFYAPWCGHCKHMQPDYEALAKDLLGDVNVAEVDVTANRDLGRRFNISGFPTLKFLRQGNTYDYRGPRTTADMKHFVLEGYKGSNSYKTPEDKGYMQDLFEEVSRVFARAVADIKNGNFFSPTIILVLLPIFLLIFFMLTCLIPVGNDDKDVAGKKE
jgi:protein disulfide-isomerase-like protein